MLQKRLLSKAMEQKLHLEKIHYKKVLALFKNNDYITFFFLLKSYARITMIKCCFFQYHVLH